MYWDNFLFSASVLVVSTRFCLCVCGGAWQLCINFYVYWWDFARFFFFVCEFVKYIHVKLSFRLLVDCLLSKVENNEIIYIHFNELYIFFRKKYFYSCLNPFLLRNKSCSWSSLRPSLKTHSYTNSTYWYEAKYGRSNPLGFSEILNALLT